MKTKAAAKCLAQQPTKESKQVSRVSATCTSNPKRETSWMQSGDSDLGILQGTEWPTNWVRLLNNETNNEEKGKMEQ